MNSSYLTGRTISYRVSTIKKSEMQLLFFLGIYPVFTAGSAIIVRKLLTIFIYDATIRFEQPAVLLHILTLDGVQFLRCINCFTNDQCTTFFVFHSFFILFFFFLNIDNYTDFNILKFNSICIIK